MKNSKKATSILEAMIVLLIVITWIIWLYNIFNSSQKLSNTTKNRIEAIEIAREWIEVMKNIRDTNWLMFGWNTRNCFNTYNYDSKCVQETTNDILTSSWYVIFQNEDHKWYLEAKNNYNSDFSVLDYRDNFRIFKENWYYTQTWSTNETIFTREVQISYSWADTNFMNVKSIVQWSDSSKEWSHKVELNDLLTNWKK